MAIVGEPLAPAVLESVNALSGWPPPDDGPFDPGGNWAHTYRIWICHGYTDKGNANRGTLRIERVAGEESSTLKVVQRIVSAGDIVHELHAQIFCRHDATASLERWTLSSRFLDPDGAVREPLSHQRAGAYRKDRIVQAIDGRPHHQPAERLLTSDWCLFDALQRRPFEDGDSPVFDLFDGLTVVRPEQRIRYAGTETFDRNGTRLPLHRFSQLGRGILPYDYWLDVNHRLLLVVSHDKAYILDPKAEAKVARRGKPPAAKGK